MTNLRIHLATSLLAAGIVTGGGLAHAQSGETADGAMKRGKSLLKAGKVHEACAAFEASDNLADTVEAKIALADCYEKDGRLMSAAEWYKRTGDDRWEKRAAELEARAPRLRLTLSQRPDGLVIKVDGVVVSNTSDVRVDIGPHEVVATAPGFEGHASTAADREKGVVDVIVRMQPTAASAPAPEAGPAPSPTPAPAAAAAASPAAGPAPALMTDDSGQSAPSGHRMRNGIILDAVGVGLVIGAAVSFSLGSDKYSTEASLCPSSKCANQAALTRANALLYNADGYRSAGTGMMIGGGVLLVVGTYLAVTGHHATEASHMAVDVAPGRAGLSFTAGF